jgi:hypothetical protein
VTATRTFVDCSAPGDCSGLISFDHEYPTPRGPGALGVVAAVTQSDGVWSRPAVLDVPKGSYFHDLPQARVHDLACYAPGECVAVGTKIWTQHDGRWSVGSQSPMLNDVSCSTGGECAAVGGSGTSWSFMTRGSGSWSEATAQAPADAYPGQGASLDAVDCPSPGSCTVVGSYLGTENDRPIEKPLVLNMSGGTWGRATAATLPPDSGVDPGRSPEIQFLGVSCASAGECTALASYYDPFANTMGRTNTMALTQSRGQLVAQKLPAAVHTIACTAPGRCVVAGNVLLDDGYGETAYGEAALLEGPVGGWRQVTPVLPTDASTRPPALLGLACPATGECVLAGSFSDQSGNRQALLLEQSSGQWQRGLNPGSPGDTELHPVSCASPGNCTAGGLNPNGAVFFTTGEGATAKLADPPPSEIRTAVTESLVVPKAEAKVVSILRQGGYKAPVTAPAPGKQTIRWLAKVRKGSASAAKQLTIASGTKRFKKPGSGTLRVKLTKQGRKLLKNSNRVTLIAIGTFQPEGGKAVKTRRKLTLK